MFIAIKKITILTLQFNYVNKQGCLYFKKIFIYKIKIKRSLNKNQQEKGKRNKDMFNYNKKYIEFFFLL